MAAPNLKEIEWAIEELKNSESSKANYIFLASLLRCRDEMLGWRDAPQIASYSQAAGPVPNSEQLGRYGDSEFFSAADGKAPEDAWKVMDRLMTALQIANPKLYTAFLDQMRQL